MESNEPAKSSKPIKFVIVDEEIPDPHSGSATEKPEPAAKNMFELAAADDASTICNKVPGE